MAESIDADELTGGKDYAPVEESAEESTAAAPIEEAPPQPAPVTTG